MNIFNDTLLRNTFQNVTKNYILNQNELDEIKIKGFLTNATLSNNSSYHFHSLEQFHRGDIVNLDNSYYMVSGDVINDRISKFKANVDYCNWNEEITHTKRIVTGIDDIGRPIYKEVVVLDRIVRGVIRYKDISVQDENAINFVKPIYSLQIRDTPANVAYYTVNKEIDLGDNNLRVFNRVFIKRGIIELRLQ